MAGFDHTFKQDYDKRIKIGDEYAFCYSKKKMSELYPEKNFSVSGEARRGNQKSRERFDASQAKKLERLKKKGLVQDDVKTLKSGDLKIGKNTLSVYPKGFNNKFFEKTDGYACLSDGTFIAIHASRVPFLVTLGSMIAAILVAIAIIIVLLLNPVPPVNPDNPLPTIDPSASPMEDDTSSKVTSENGGGSITISFIPIVDVHLTDNKAALTYNNPNASNHDVVVELYVKDSEGKEYFLGRSERVPAGYTLKQMSLKDREVDLTLGGEYEGRLYIHAYDPITGEKSLVVTDIDDIEIIVKN